MEVKRIIILGSLIVTLLVLAIIFFRSSGEEKIKPAPAETSFDPEGFGIGSEETKTIQLFFPSDEDSLLHPEEREIIDSSSIVKQARQTIEELLKGSRNGSLSPFPPETKLRGLFFSANGIVHVDFSKEIQEKHISGSAAEISTVYSIVNSLTYNFKSIKKVFILIEGREKETLGGHIDLSRPLLPQYELIAN